MLTKRLHFVILWMLAGTVLTGAVWLISANQTIDYARNTGRDAINRVSTKTDIVHGNDDRNNRLHIVYEIYGITRSGDYSTIKYGITCQKCFVSRLGNPRPEYQIPFLKGIFPHLNISYKILHENIPSRSEAKRIEKEYVKKYFNKHKRMPLRQNRPNPIR